MREDILTGQYRDPFEMDLFESNRLDDFSNETQFLASKLEENRNEKGFQHYSDSEVYEDYEDTCQARRKTRKVNLNSPWDGDQAMTWPDYEAEAFEKAVEEFRGRPESNTGYESKALLKAIEDKYGKDFLKKALEKVRPQKKKESIQKRFEKALKEGRTR